MLQPRPRSTLFPYTTLFRSRGLLGRGLGSRRRLLGGGLLGLLGLVAVVLGHGSPTGSSVRAPAAAADRKSTRLNSSHMSISYAVFCLKKKILLLPFQLRCLS